MFNLKFRYKPVLKIYLFCPIVVVEKFIFTYLSKMPKFRERIFRYLEKYDLFYVLLRRIFAVGLSTMTDELTLYRFLNK